ncbi:MAG: hypothetical protein OHK0011_13350 [Turneriella sp.]
MKIMIRIVRFLLMVLAASQFLPAQARNLSREIRRDSDERDLYIRIFEAAADNDLENLKIHFQKRPNPNAIRHTLLNADKKPTFTIVMARGRALNNFPVVQGNTLLSYAVTRRNREMAQYLLSQGADPQLVTDHTFNGIASVSSPFMIAADMNDVEMLRLLLPKVRDINHHAAPYTGRIAVTPLHVALGIRTAVTGNIQPKHEAAMFLAANGARCNFEAHRDTVLNLLTYAIDKGESEVAQTLLRKG